MSVSLLIRRVECIISLDRIFASTQGASTLCCFVGSLFIFFWSKNKYISGQLMDGLFNSWYLKVWERCSPGKVTFFLKRRVMSLIFCNQGSLRRRHVICLLFFATKTYRYFHHSGLLIWSVECILVFESLILPLSFFWNAECLPEYCHFLVLSPICSNWPSF